MPSAPGRRRPLPDRVAELAVEQAGVLGRRQLYALGVNRWQVEARLRSGRWQRTGRQSVATTTGPLGAAAARWVALLEVGPRAALDGITALQHAGLTTIDEAVVHVAVPKSSTPRRPKGVLVHETRRFREADVLTNGARRTKPEVAVVHAALWARSDRQATLYVIAAVQQRIVTVERVAAALAAVRRHRRRALLHQLLVDVAAGAQALGELDLARAARARGLPEPTRQVVLRRGDGRVYLDVDWEQHRVALELDGVQHDAAPHRLQDVLRDLDTAATGRLVVRLPLWAFRLDPDAVLDRLAAVLEARTPRAA